MEFDLNGRLVRTENQFSIGDPKAYAARMAAEKRNKPTEQASI